MRKLVTTILATMACCTAYAAQEISTRAEFQEQIPGWAVVGDFDAGACIALMQTGQQTSLSIASIPNRPRLLFSIKNASWASIKNEEDMRVNAVFRIRGRPVDGWSLDAVGMNTDETGPGFKFEIDNAKNDDASFLSHFSRSETLEFFNGKVPVGKFSLARSKDAISLLYKCRDQLRANPNFDPFAK
jgi:hypothetical protein